MKKMLAILLALLMMLTGMATAEETTDNNTNISHMLELCQRVDILLRSDRIVTDLVGDTDAAITEEQKIVNRLRAGNRTMPSAVYYVTGETLLTGFIGDNPDYTDTPEQRRVIQLMPQHFDGAAGYIWQANAEPDGALDAVSQAGRRAGNGHVYRAVRGCAADDELLDQRWHGERHVLHAGALG